jgi:2-methylcitrate dehydratase
MDRTTEHLVGFLIQAAAEPLSQAALQAGKRRVIDSIACALGAMDESLCRRIRALARRYPGQPSAAVWGTALRAAPDMAAFANGVAIRYLDHSDTYVSKSPGHPSDVIAGIFAAAEIEGASGRQTLAAVAAGYDVYCDFLDAAASHTKGVDQATAAALGVAAGAGVLMRLPRPAFAHALSMAIVPNVHLNAVRHGELSDWKGCAGPNGARGGLFAVILAQEGVTGPSDPFDGPGGLTSIVGGMAWQSSANMPRKIEQSDIKTFPVCYHGLAAVEAALQLRDRIALAALQTVEIETYALSVTRMANEPTRWAPSTRETADHSLPYVVATALRDGALTSASYAPARLGDPALRDLMNKVRVKATEEMTAAYPAAAPARLTAILQSGERHVAEIRFPKGHGSNPISDTELEAKFFDLAGPRMERAHARRLLDLLWAFETVPAAADLPRAIGVISEA